MRRAAVVHGVMAGLVAGVPQVLLTQAEARLLRLAPQRADIGPRFVQRLAMHVDQALPPAPRWALAAVFHFGYAAGWGSMYAMAQEKRPMRPLIGGPLLAALVYTIAFSPWGVATRTGGERPPESRPERESLLHWTAALSFGLVTAYTFDWLRSRAAAIRPLAGPQAR